MKIYLTNLKNPINKYDMLTVIDSILKLPETEVILPRFCDSLSITKENSVEILAGEAAAIDNDSEIKYIISKKATSCLQICFFDENNNFYLTHFNNGFLINWTDALTKLSGSTIGCKILCGNSGTDSLENMRSFVTQLQTLSKVEYDKEIHIISQFCLTNNALFHPHTKAKNDALYEKYLQGFDKDTIKYARFTLLQNIAIDTSGNVYEITNIAPKHTIAKQRIARMLQNTNSYLQCDLLSTLLVYNKNNFTISNTTIASCEIISKYDLNLDFLLNAYQKVKHLKTRDNIINFMKVNIAPRLIKCDNKEQQNKLHTSFANERADIYIYLAHLYKEHKKSLKPSKLKLGY